LSEFVEWTSKDPKPYKCKRCQAPIQYAKFWGPDKKLLTTDGKPEHWKNVGWPTDPKTKQMHECAPKDVPESQLKKTDTIDSGWGDTKSLKVKEFPLDELIIKKQIEEDNKLLPLIWARFLNVEDFVKVKGRDNPPLNGLIFKILALGDREE